MSTDKIKYKAGYKYQLAEDLIIKTPIYPQDNIDIEFIKLNIDGVLVIKAGYAWDGCSGTTIDTNTNMRAGCVHDAFFQLMRLNLIDRNKYFHDVNNCFYWLLIEDGMTNFRAWYYFKAVEKFSWKYTLKEKESPVITAP